MLNFYVTNNNMPNFTTTLNKKLLPTFAIYALCRAPVRSAQKLFLERWWNLHPRLCGPQSLAHCVARHASKLFNNQTKEPRTKQKVGQHRCKTYLKSSTLIWNLSLVSKTFSSPNFFQVILPNVASVLE